MAGSERGAEERVRAVVGVGARLADGGDVLGREARARLPGVTGLSVEGVELALREYLETGASAGEIGAFVGRARGAARCHVILSANVCTAALRAIAFAVATAPRVRVKASRRDPVVAELVVRALAEEAAFAAAGGAIVQVTAIGGEAARGEEGPRAGDEVHVYGADETIAAVRAGLAEGVVLRGHGAGLGVVVIGGDVELVGAARDLARDVVVFDQRGCLSPRVVLVAGEEERAVVFGRALGGALGELQGRVPRGPLEEGARAEVSRYVATAQALGVCFVGDGFVVGVAEGRPGALVVPPAARVVHVVSADGASAARCLAPWGSKVVALGVAGASEVVDVARGAAPHARVSSLGRMQRPPFDGPVDLRPT